MPFELNLTVGLAFVVGLLAGFLAGFLAGRKQPRGAQVRIRTAEMKLALQKIKVTGKVTVDPGSDLKKFSGKVYDNTTFDRTDEDPNAEAIVPNPTTGEFDALLEPVNGTSPDRVIVWAKTLNTSGVEKWDRGKLNFTY